MKVLVTGGAGFIGSHLVDLFIEEGFDVAVIDDLSTGFEKNLNPKAKFYKADIRDGKKVEEIFSKEKPDFVSHHAAQMDVRKSVSNQLFDAECNILGSMSVIVSSANHGVKKLIYASTGGVLYGQPKALPANELHPVNPLCQYGISKHTVEHYLHLYARNYGLNYTALRYANVFGQRQNPRGEAGVIAIFIGKMLKKNSPVIYGDGNQTRDYVFVKDIAEANLSALKKGKNEVINLGSGKETSVNKIFSELSKLMDFSKEPIFKEKRIGEIDRICLDSSKAKKLLGWNPKTSFSEGLKKTIEWQKENK